MKKTLLALTAFSTLGTLSLHARTLMCEQCEAEPVPCCEEQLFVERSQLFVHAEFLYWTVEEGAFDYAVKQTKTTTAPNAFALGDYKVADYDWSPGYRVAVSYYKCPKYWEITGQYTWLYTKGSDSTLDPLNPTRQVLTSAPFRKASSLVDLHYHVGDLYVARVFDPNPHLRLRLLGGLTASHIEQAWKIRYSNFQGDFDKIKEKWRFWAGGFRFGLTADWFWGCQFYLTAKTSLAALLGSYKNERIQTNGTNELLLGDATYDDHRFSWNAQFLLGPSWQVPCDCWSFELFAGYEFNIWFNLQERIRSEFNGPDGTKATCFSDGLFGLHGLTARLTLGF